MSVTAEVDLDSMPSLVKAEGVVAYCEEIGVTSMTERFVKVSTERGELPYALIRNMRHYAKSDVREWLRGMVAPGTRTPVATRKRRLPA